MITAFASVAGCSPADDSADDGEGTVVQAVGPNAPAVLPDAGTVATYATACGLGDPPNMDLPELGDGTTPIRGTNDGTQVGKLTSRGWTLVQHFENRAADLASLETLKGNLWHKTEGREWYYLYRYANADPTVKQQIANGILGFDATSICALDKLIANDVPPASINDLYYAGQFDNDRTKMDDCSDCHLAGYNAPRPKALAVAKGNNGANQFPWLKVKWLPPWQQFSAAFGPVWNLGKATVIDKWTSGAGMALVTPPRECQRCHLDWVPVRALGTGMYCDTVFAKAFDGNGSMTAERRAFRDNATCTTFLTDIGCGPGRPGGAPDLSATLCPLPPPPPPAPLVNDNRMQIQGIQVVSSTVVNIIPAQNPLVTWDLGSVSAFGDPWVGTVQVWGGPYPGSTTSPMSPPISVSVPSALPPFIQITGLTPGQTYQFQLQLTDGDTSEAFTSLVNVTMPGVDVEPAGDNIALNLMSGTQAVVTLGSSTLRCTTSHISGTIPATGNPGDPVTVALSPPTFASCTAQVSGLSVAATVTTNGSPFIEEGCGNNFPIFHIPQGGEKITATVLGLTCTITLAPAGAVDVPGTWTNGSPSTLAISGTVPVSTSGGFPCPSATSVTFSAEYAVTDITTPGSNVTVTKSGCSQ